ncbi:MAG: zf-HC2 domain-containing protein [Planctomycetota bacterium]
MISCEKVRRLLPLHAGGDIGGRQEHAIDDHLSQCLGCYRVFQEHLEGVTSLKVSREHSDPGPEFWQAFEDDVMSRARESVAVTSSPATWRLSAHRPLLAAAASFLLALTVWFAFEPESSKPLSKADRPPVAISHIVPIYEGGESTGLERVSASGRRSVSTREEGELMRLMRQLDYPSGADDIRQLERMQTEYHSEIDDGIFR